MIRDNYSDKMETPLFACWPSETSSPKRPGSRLQFSGDSASSLVEVSSLGQDLNPFRTQSYGDRKHKFLNLVIGSDGKWSYFYFSLLVPRPTYSFYRASVV